MRAYRSVLSSRSCGPIVPGPFGCRTYSPIGAWQNCGGKYGSWPACEHPHDSSRPLQPSGSGFRLHDDDEVCRLPMRPRSLPRGRRTATSIRAAPLDICGRGRTAAVLRPRGEKISNKARISLLVIQQRPILRRACWQICGHFHE